MSVTLFKAFSRAVMLLGACTTLSACGTLLDILSPSGIEASNHQDLDSQNASPEPTGRAVEASFTATPSPDPNCLDGDCINGTGTYRLWLDKYTGPFVNKLPQPSESAIFEEYSPFSGINTYKGYVATYRMAQKHPNMDPTYTIRSTIYPIAGSVKYGNGDSFEGAFTMGQRSSGKYNFANGETVNLPYVMTSVYMGVPNLVIEPNYLPPSPVNPTDSGSSRAATADGSSSANTSNQGDEDNSRFICERIKRPDLCGFIAD